MGIEPASTPPLHCLPSRDCGEVEPGFCTPRWATRRTEARGPEVVKPPNGINGAQSVPPPVSAEELKVAPAVPQGT